MTTFTVLFFLWVASPSGRDFAVNEGIEVQLQERCDALGGTLTKWHSPIRKYRFTWDGEQYEQKVWSGWDYVCLREES